MFTKLTNYLSAFRKGKQPEKKWEQNEYFDPAWKARIRQMAEFIKEGESVVDFGCGEGWLQEFLPAGSIYTGVDYTRRNDKTLVCNLNTDPFPSLVGDCAFVSGCLEYLENPAAFVSSVSSHFKKCVISYCTLEEFPNLAQRANLYWKNNLKSTELIALFDQNAMQLTTSTITDSRNSIFVFVAR